MMKICTLVMGMVGSKLVIHSPQKLVDLFQDHSTTKGTPGLIKASYANFGLIPYGHSMVSFFSESIILFLVKKVGKLFFDERNDIMCQNVLKSNEDIDKHLHEEKMKR